jgi:two-component system LytT family sensor kinase
MESHERESYVKNLLDRAIATFIRHHRFFRSVGRILIVSLIVAVALSMASLSVGNDWPTFTWFSVNLLTQHLLIYYLMGYWLLPRLLYKRRLGWLLLWIVLGFWGAYLINRAVVLTVEPTQPKSIHYISQIRTFLDGRGWFGPFLSLRVFLWNFVFSIFSPFIFLTLKVIKDTTVLRQQQFQLTRNRLLLDRDNAVLKQDFLKAQVSPHFLFNTLNSIYSHVVSTDDGAADMVLRLAELMRYNLDTASAAQVLVQQEIDYLQSYIVLEQARHGDRLFVEVDVSGNLTDYLIAPLLLGTYVENAFKHGIRSGTEGSYVLVKVALEADTLLFMVENSISQGPTVVVARKAGGVGLPNVKKRLALLYPDHHSIEHDITDQYYRVTLRIDLTRVGAPRTLAQSTAQ